MITINFTYEIITPESAEYGDFAEAGFITPGFWKYSADDYERNTWKLGDLKGLISFAESLGIISDGDSFYSVDPDCNYATGEETFYGMHIAGVTDATLSRLHKLFRNI